MKRLLGVAAITILASAFLAFSPAPASAGNDHCSGQGTAATASAVYYIGLGPSASGSVTFTFSVGGCVLGHSNTANGQFTANAVGNFCGQSTGSVSIDHHSGTWQSAGSMLVLNGGINGAVNAVPDATQGQSCTSGATRFLVSGSVALT